MGCDESSEQTRRHAGRRLSKNDVHEGAEIEQRVDVLVQEANVVRDVGLVGIELLELLLVQLTHAVHGTGDGLVIEEGTRLQVARVLHENDGVLALNERERERVSHDRDIGERASVVPLRRMDER